MAQYPPEQRHRHQVTILATSGIAIVLLLLAAAGGLIPFGGVFSGLFVVALIASSCWWLFASRRAGNIDGTWVEGDPKATFEFFAIGDWSARRRRNEDEN